MNPRPYKLIALVALAAVCLLAVSGCDSLRFAPTEPQKQTAELTHGLAVKINAEGTDPASPASQQLIKGTQAALVFMGRPKVPADPAQFDTVAEQAAVDAAERPVADDVFEAADRGLSLAAELAILFGVGGTGFAGKKVIDWLAIAKSKNKALSEIVHGNELFKVNVKESLAGQAAPEKVLDIFKASQNQKQVSPKTKAIVTEIKNS